jgi:hypothetical protein
MASEEGRGKLQENRDGRKIEMIHEKEYLDKEEKGRD